MEISWTFELAYSSSPPIGAKMTPTPNRSGRTVLGVRMGCHAFRRCWRKAVSVLHHQRCHFQAHCAGSRLADVLGGLLLFCFLSGSSFSRKLLESVCSMVCDITGVRCVVARAGEEADYCTERDVVLRARCRSFPTPARPFVSSSAARPRVRPAPGCLHSIA